MLMRDGTLLPVTSRAHPDQRVQVMLEQTRERGILQAIARLRLVAPQAPKRVVILGCTPLPDFPVSILAPFLSVAYGLEDEPDPVGYRRLEAALSTHGGRPVRGVRMSATGLASDLSRDFAIVCAAKEFRRGRDTGALDGLIRRIAAARGWPLSLIDLTKKKGGGRPVRAGVFCRSSNAAELAKSLWPEMELVVPEGVV